jgi:hypothetical protein
MAMASTLTDEDWDDLMDLIAAGSCTPFIGAGASASILPLGRGLAKKWATSYNYPLKDFESLTRVAQFLSIQKFGIFPKSQIKKLFVGAGSPDFDDPDEPHAVLADLQLPIYITTNYDSFMLDAITHKNPNRIPRREICPWYESPDERAQRSRDPKHRPKPEEPLVFHLHGYYEVPKSLVLTEDDYLNFLITLSSHTRSDSKTGLLPPAILEALAESALLFVGYSLADWTFRVLFRGLTKSAFRGNRWPCIAIQLPPEDAMDGKQDRAQEYLARYFETVVTEGADVKVHFGDVRDFTSTLRQRWEAYQDGQKRH